MQLKTATRHKPVCRDRHFSIKKNNANDLVNCHVCKAHVERTDLNTCDCCGAEIGQQAQNFTILHRVMNKFLKEYQTIIEDWTACPTSKPVTLGPIRHGPFTYKINIRFAALYLEVRNMDRQLFPAPNNWDGKFCQWSFDYTELDKRTKQNPLSPRRQRILTEYDKQQKIYSTISKELFWLS